MPLHPKFFMYLLRIRTFTYVTIVQLSNSGYLIWPIYKFYYSSCLLVQGPIQNQILLVVVMSLDSFNLEQLQIRIYMYWLMFFFFHYTLKPMRARAGPSTVLGTELM